MKRIVSMILLVLIVSAGCSNHLSNNNLNSQKLREQYAKELMSEANFLSKIADNIDNNNLGEAKSSLDTYINEHQSEWQSHQTAVFTYLGNVYSKQTAQLIEVSIDRYHLIISDLDKALASQETSPKAKESWKMIAEKIKKFNNNYIDKNGEENKVITITLMQTLLSPEDCKKSFGLDQINQLIINFSAEANGLDRYILKSTREYD